MVGDNMVMLYWLNGKMFYVLSHPTKVGLSFQL